MDTRLQNKWKERFNYSIQSTTPLDTVPTDVLIHKAHTVQDRTLADAESKYTRASRTLDPPSNPSSSLSPLKSTLSKRNTHTLETVQNLMRGRSKQDTSVTPNQSPACRSQSRVKSIRLTILSAQAVPLAPVRVGVASTQGVSVTRTSVIARGYATNRNYIVIHDQHVTRVRAIRGLI